MASSSLHDAAVASHLERVGPSQPDPEFTYTFENFFHPYVGELIATLNKGSVADLLKAQVTIAPQLFFNALYHPASLGVEVKSSPKEIDVAPHGPYSNYNWELFFHIPLAIAVHLSKNQRFAEAQRWFHYIFNPTVSDGSPKPSTEFWKFLAFRNAGAPMRIEDIVRLLSTPKPELSPEDKKAQKDILVQYKAIRDTPFQPYAPAATRLIAHEYSVFMKYQDNLIAWGDILFQQDTSESINEATQIYVLAANILGQRPQRVPATGRVKPKTFAELKGGLGDIADALVDLEVQFPFDSIAVNSGQNGGDAAGSPLFGLGRTLYFCVPANEKLLRYWDIVADRLFKIRHCMNIEGIVRPLALFDPPIDPGMLVKAAAAGLDVASIVNGINQPAGPLRSLPMLQKTLELCGELRALGNALLAVIEKGEAEKLALVRQRHEIQIQRMAQDVRFLQWKAAEEATTSLLTSRQTALERLRYYARLLDVPADQNPPDIISLDRRELTEENFDEAYAALVDQYDKTVTRQALPELAHASDSPTTFISGFKGDGHVYLSRNEDKELNVHLPIARDAHLIASAANTIASALMPIPSVNVHGHFWGIGPSSQIVSGEVIAAISKFAAEIAELTAVWETNQANMAARYAGYERRADEWLFQYNLAAYELKQIGRQILTSLIAEQVAHHEYLNVQQQIRNAEEIDQVLRDKFTSEDLYLWMQGELSRLYYEYYRFTFDTARRTVRTVKQELMRPEVDAQEFVKFNYWDGGRKGLLSGDALYLDVKRLEMAYHEHNRRELELTKHVSLRQLNPMQLLALRATGVCQVTVPEWLYDLDCPGHYMRRIKTVAVSIPAITGPHTSVACTLSLLRSSLRKLPEGKDYARLPDEHDRFIDYIGAVQSIVTSTGQNDGGLFEMNLRDERFLPFEGAGAESTWRIALPPPGKYPAFDYSTIADVILHIRYTARQGIEPTKVQDALAEMFKEADSGGLALLVSLRRELAAEWSAFVHGKDSEPFKAVIGRNYFPYLTQNKKITATQLELVDGADPSSRRTIGEQFVLATNQQTFMVSAHADAQVLTRSPNADVFLIVRYTLAS